jgi:hypothetical protein
MDLKENLDVVLVDVYLSIQGLMMMMILDVLYLLSVEIMAFSWSHDS